MSDESLKIGPFPANIYGKTKFIAALLEAGNKGYKLPEKNFNKLARLHFGTRLSVTLYKEGVAIKDESPETVVSLPPIEMETVVSNVFDVDVIEKAILAKETGIAKSDLIEFAKVKGITIPDKVKVPAAIRKHIASELAKKDKQDSE